MRRKRWRFYETTSGAKPVQAFLDNLTATSRPTPPSSPKATQPPSPDIRESVSRNRTQ